MVFGSDGELHILVVQGAKVGLRGEKEEVVVVVLCEGTLGWKKKKSLQ